VQSLWPTHPYIPMRRGFLDVGFCVEAVQEALARFGCPEIFNTDSKMTASAGSDDRVAAKR
jgi:hypothetical protein